MTAGFSELLPLMQEELLAGRSISFTPFGNSMLPLLHAGKDKVTLTLEVPCKHDIIFFRRKDGSFVLHRILSINGTNFIVRGDSQYWTEQVPREAVLGVVTGYVLKGHSHVRQDLFDRNYIFFLPMIRLFYRVLRKWKGLFHEQL